MHNGIVLLCTDHVATQLRNNDFIQRIQHENSSFGAHMTLYRLPLVFSCISFSWSQFALRLVAMPKVYCIDVVIHYSTNALQIG